MIAGDPGNQWEWHEAYRDLANNMYRTSYADMSQGREVHVRSDFPSGYGGYVPSVKHDVLFRNTAFEKSSALKWNNPDRESFPSFENQIMGIPASTPFPRGARRVPNQGTGAQGRDTADVKPPWAVWKAACQPLNHRRSPPTLKRSASAPAPANRNNAATMSADSESRSQKQLPAARPASALADFRQAGMPSGQRASRPSSATGRRASRPSSAGSLSHTRLPSSWLAGERSLTGQKTSETSFLEKQLRKTM